MSIEDEQGNSIVRLGTLHAAAFKMLIWIGMIATPAAFGLFWSHSESIRLHEWRITSLERTSGRSAANSNTNIITSDAAKMAQDATKSARTYLTTAEVAKREQVSERTVTDWITDGRIIPAPVKEGKEWRISAQYRIPPQTAAVSGSKEAEP